MSGATVEIVADRLNHAFGDHRALHDISLTIDPGARIGIVGESGSGKTTLARLLTGALMAQEDRVTVNGVPWRQVGRRSDIRRQVQLIFQDPYASLTSSLTAHTAVQEAVRVCRKVSRREAAAEAERLLDSVGLGRAVAACRPGRLSGGQCQRVAIARALAAEPSVIVADEPTSALDLSVQGQIINLLLEVMTIRGVGLVLVSHDLAVVRHLTEQLVVLRNGEIVERGPTLEVLAAPRHDYTRALCEASQLGHRSPTAAPAQSEPLTAAVEPVR